MDKNKNKNYYGYFKLSTLVRSKVSEYFTNATYKVVAEEDINDFLVKKIIEQSGFLKYFFKDKNKLITQIAEIYDLVSILSFRFNINKEEIEAYRENLKIEKGEYNNLILEILGINKDLEPELFNQYMKYYKLQNISTKKLTD